MELKEENEILKNFCIFMCKVYQKNYDEFASPANVDYRLNLSKEEKDLRSDFFMSFSTVQGFSLRKLVEDITKLDHSRKCEIEKLKEIFKTA